MSSTGESSRACSHPTLEPAEQPSETCKTPTQAASCHEDHVGSNGSTEDLRQNDCREKARLKETGQTEGAAAAMCHSRGDAGTESESSRLQRCQHHRAGARSPKPQGSGGCYLQQFGRELVLPMHARSLHGEPFLFIFLLFS